MATTTPISTAQFEAPLLLAEPGPIWSDAPRLNPDVDFPPYRYIRNLNPHPLLDPDGHSFVSRPAAQALRQDTWPSHGAYRFGVDLYHQGYLWESQTTWGAILRKCDSDSIEANLLHALILNASAQLKAHIGEMASVRMRSQAARWRLARIRQAGYADAKTRFMGLDIADLIDQMKSHYASFWNDDEHAVRSGPAPRLRLEE